MDSLDLDVHSAILISLAQSYAASTPTEEPVQILAKLPSSILADHSSAPKFEGRDEPKQIAATSPVLSEEVKITHQQAHHVIAYAAYISQCAASGVSLPSKAIQRLCHMLKNLANWSIDLNLSMENAAEWPLMDEIAHRLLVAMLEIGTSVTASDKERLVEALSSLVGNVAQGILNASPNRIVTHFLPVLSGMRRALGARSFSFTIDDFSLLFPSITDSPIVSPSDHLKQTLASAITDPCGPNSTDYRQVDKIKARYEAIGMPLTANMIVYAGLQQCRNVLERCLMPDNSSSSNKDSLHASNDTGWVNLTRSGSKKKQLGLNCNAIHDANVRSVAMFQEYCDVYQRDLASENPEEYLVEIICEIIKLSILCALTLGTVSDEVFNQLLALHTEDAVIIHPSVQITATESLVILAQNFPQLVPGIAQTLRSYVTSIVPPPDATRKKDVDDPEQSVLAAAHGLAVCVELTQSTDFTKATMYALVNHINVSENDVNEQRANSTDVLADQRTSDMTSQLDAHSPDGQQIIAINALSALLALLNKLNQVELNSLIAPMLLLRLKGASPDLETVILLAIADLALRVNKPTFEDVIATFTSLSKAMPLESSSAATDIVFQFGIHRAHMKLSKSLGDEEELSEIYLTELLTLFIDKGKSIQTTHTTLPSFHQLANHLGVLISGIGNLLQPASNYNPRRTASPKLSELFRNFWYVCVLFGFLSSGNSRTATGSPSVPPDWLIISLRQIATKSPTLTHLTSIDYLTTQLDYNPILKFPDASFSTTPSKIKPSHTNAPSPHQLAVEQAKKQELANLIPTHSGQIKSLNFVQTIFLLTVGRLEIFRAEDCRASNILEYFSHVSPDEIDVHNLFGCLVTISEKVLATFIASFQQHAIRHNEVAHVYYEIPEILKFTCHHSSRIRAIALRYCQDMIIAFPTLLCDFGTILTMLELLTLLRVSCEGEYDDEYTPKYTFRSESADLTIVLIDDYAIRQQTLNDLYKSTKHWLSIAIARAPLEMKSIFLRYLDGVSSPGVHDPIGNIEMGKSIALEMAKMLPSNSQLSHLPSWGGWSADLSHDLARSFSSRMFYNGQAMHLSSLPENELKDSLENLKLELDQIMKQVTSGGKRTSISQLSSALHRAGTHVMASPKPDMEILHHIVSIPIRIFTPLSISLGLEVWTWLIDVKPEIEIKFLTEVITMWSWTLCRRKGLFSNALDLINPLDQSIQFTPTDREEMQHKSNLIKKMLKPHSILVDFLSSRFQAARYKSRSVVAAMIRLLRQSFANVKLWSKHPLTRELRTRLLIFGFSICQGSRMEDSVEHILRELCYRASFDWFTLPCSFSFGSNRLQHESELRLLQELLEMVKVDQPVNAYHISSMDMNSARHLLPGRVTLSAAAITHADRNHLLQLFLEHEVIRLMAWNNPLSDPKKGRDLEATVAKSMGEAKWRSMAQVSWAIDPQLTLRLAERFKNPHVDEETSRLIKQHPNVARNVSEALDYFVGQFDPQIIPNLHHILYWKKTPVLTALTYFLPQYDSDPVLLQYAMRVLEEHPVEVTFFYVPQVVQALRTDSLGYVERFICETAKVSQLFCHQIIWNMKANTFKGDDAVEPDPMKPTLDRIMASIVDSLSGEAKKFYETEFKFFDEVTGISKTLKDYLKKDKSEKKAKITEELAKIEVIKGVYLPSNPDGTVIDIDRNSGRPLQSHAKTPFMATFKVHREKAVHLDDDLNGTEEEIEIRGVDTWQAAIFKVGDDCRQDVLALQLIAIHKTIYETMCLDLHLVPYRVTATAPGCGVIDVIPDATSRDEMGRAKINDLNSFFLGKFGPADSVAYQTARMNFIRSMAAYSVMCYLIQIKDRHNGNIMIDGEGHITHIDFGFLFDIGPGGIKFEPNSFKLTGEMIVLMGGQHSAGFRFFQELVVKAFLIARPFAKEIVMAVKLMSETQLPSFKGEMTMSRLMERFKPQLSERDAALYMQGVIANAKQNGLSLLYDEFQWVTNEIPYTQRDWIARAS